MSTFTQLLAHIVFATKHRVDALEKEHRSDLFAYMGGIAKNNNCQPIQIGGIENHVHLLIDVHPQIAISDLVKRLKLGSRHFIKKRCVKGQFEEFRAWQEGFGAFSVDYGNRDRLIQYIKNQEAHHAAKRNLSFRNELKALLRKYGIPFEDKWLP